MKINTVGTSNDVDLCSVEKNLFIGLALIDTETGFINIILDFIDQQ